MTWAMVGSAAISAVGGYMSNKSANKGAGAQSAFAQKGIDTINGYYDDAKGFMQPYMDTGIIANTGINKLLGGDYSGFYNSPDFQAAMQGGRDMLDNSAAARGGLFGGGQQRALTGYGQQLASQYLGNYRNWLGNTSAAGQNAATNLGQLGMGAGNSIANLYGNMGAASAQKANNNSGMIGGLFSTGANLFGGLMGGK